MHLPDLAFLLDKHTPESDILMLLGLALFSGSVAGRLFKKLRIPQVVGYIMTGFLAGNSCLNLVSIETVKHLQPFNYFALGLIGFMIGGELKASNLARYGKQLFSILMLESMLAFIVVFLLVTGTCTFFYDLKLSLAFGLLLGSIAAATAPAATTDVLWEYKTKGPLTTIILGIVALDDGIALALFAIATSIAASLVGNTEGSVWSIIWKPIYELFGAVALGSLAGYILKEVIKRSDDSGKVLTSSIGAILIVVALARLVGMDFLLAAMTVGAIITNLNPHKSIDVFTTVEKFTPPIFIVFFVLFGIKMDLSHLSLSTSILVIVYLVSRTTGKMLGARWGAKISGAPETVQKYLPYCLFSQAGVAIGLSILAGQYFSDSIGSTIVIVITASTFVVQIIGPSMVKYSVTKAGEVGKNVTEQDLMQQLKTSEVMYRDVPVLQEESAIKDILSAFTRGPQLWFPVLDKERHLLGIISVEHIKDVLMLSELGQLLLAHDLMEPVKVFTKQDDPLSESQKTMKSHNMEYLPVLDESEKFLGILEMRAIESAVSMKLISIQNS